MNKVLFFVFVVFLTLNSCKRNSNKNNNNKIVDSIENVNQDSNQFTSNDIVVENLDTTIIDSAKIGTEKDRKCPVFLENDIPSPTDFKYAVEKTKPNFENLFPITKKYQLSNIFQKSLALGILSADMVYSATYENASYTTKYFNATMNLSDDLGISNVFSQEDYKIIREFENQDTVREIIENSLESICIQLNESKVYNQLPFILYGSWIESVYLLTNILVSNPDAPKELYKELAKQKEVIEHLTDYYNNILLDADDYETNLNIQNIIGELSPIHYILENSLRTNSYIMDKEQMKKLIQVLSDIRNNITEGTDKKIEEQQIKYQENLEKKD